MHRELAALNSDFFKNTSEHTYIQIFDILILVKSETD